MTSMHLSAPRQLRSTLYYLIAAAALVVAALALQTYGQQPAETKPPEPRGVELIKKDAAALMPTLKSELAKRFAGASKDLPKQETRTLYRHKRTRAWMTRADFDKLTEEQKKEVVERPLDETFYYYTGYGSPLAYTRPLEILAERGTSDLKGNRVMDFGCGGVAPVRLMAALGADAVGVDVEPLFPLYYNQPGDQGEVTSENGKGNITLVTGRWPADEAAKKAVSGGYDLIISKNTLKKGYVTPEAPADERFLVKLGVADVNFCKALFDALKPGGRVLIYNLCPKQDKEKYLPMADGRCPFSKEMLERVGFKVLAFDVDDGPECRKMAHTLGWDSGEQPMDLEGDLFAHYTLFERPS